MMAYPDKSPEREQQHEIARLQQENERLRTEYRAARLEAERLRQEQSSDSPAYGELLEELERLRAAIEERHGTVIGEKDLLRLRRIEEAARELLRADDYWVTTMQDQRARVAVVRAQSALRTALTEGEADE